MRASVRNHWPVVSSSQRPAKTPRVFVAEGGWLRAVVAESQPKVVAERKGCQPYISSIGNTRERWRARQADALLASGGGCHDGGAGRPVL
eukprot:scaffold38528_cov21-Tisochrysis_lutea.AAC.3